ncbi:hypothetical protein HYALB_00001124 [Hymenoscyphus albidus]|uniref:Peptide N-acetyl-beta-D-glucosaminyl asparaginase amidase A N-terminal domain-containing protein n=1 Tax=Hymenoscyphus albidus TaxID=595503 RepID=A0A9N9PY56_9HELO|nr:hypothetical protein HYALB_00001124 [Hymenoscyphus albidus]
MVSKIHSQSTKPREMEKYTTPFPSYTQEGTSVSHLHITPPQGKRPGSCKLLASTIAGCCVALLWVFGGCYTFGNSKGIAPSPFANYNLVKNAVHAVIAAPNSAVLECFQVYPPVLFPSGAINSTVSSDGLKSTPIIATVDTTSSCQVLLMDQSFGYSYGIPFVGNYTPPDCTFNRVAMNFSVKSSGRQYDRLALMYFNDTEVWRTSTAEPTVNGIHWEYIKDMTEYLYFWNSPQTLIFDLGNLINDIYTGPFNTTLTATFYTSEETASPASLIVPISTRKGSTNSASLFTLPGENATNTIIFPRNANRAVFSISACGQSTEEFWWGNVLQSNINTFEPYAGTLYGYSTFREVQVLIDGQLAGVQWPFPVIFTGGVVPGLWRPIVGIDAFDLREHEIDITPWLPILSDGQQHTFEIRVAGIEDDGKEGGALTETVGASWYVTGKIFLWQDSESSITTGLAPTVSIPAPLISVSQILTQNATGANETLTYTTDVKRTISVSSLIKTETGGERQVTWTQNLTFSNYGKYTLFGAIQVSKQFTTGTDESTGGVYYKSTYCYPLFANTSYLVQPSGNFTLDAVLDLGLKLTYQGTPVFPTGLQPFRHIRQSKDLVPSFSGTSLNTRQNGTAHYFGSPSAGTSSGFGSTAQEFRFSGLSTEEKELYYRSVEAVNATIVRDVESLVGKEVGRYSVPAEAVGKGAVTVGVISAKEAIGRGPGKMRDVLVQSGN